MRLPVHGVTGVCLMWMPDCPANHMCFDGMCMESDGPPCGSDSDCTGDAAYCKMDPMQPGMPGHCVECIPDMHGTHRDPLLSPW